MNNYINQPFVYNGQVKIYAQKGKTVFYKYSSHNAGTKNLFHGLCNLLAGMSYNSQKEYMPQYIRLYNRELQPTSTDYASEYIYTPLTDAIKYNSTIQVKPYSTDSEIDSYNNYVVVFHFTVPGTIISKGNGVINYLRLYGEASSGGALVDEGSELADFVIETPVNPVMLTANTQYIVEWSLGFSNAPQTD